jgi:hypothetical protein
MADIMGNSTLALIRFSSAFRTEMRLLVVNWIYPLLHPLWAALLTWTFVGRDFRSAQALLETTLGGMSIGLISLAGLFLAGLSASRSQRVKFKELEATLPTGFEVEAGRWLAGLTALGLFLVEPLVIAGLQGPLSSMIKVLPIYLGEAALTIALTTAAGWWLVSWLGRWAYPLLAAGWLGFLLGPVMLTDVYPYASLLNFMRQGTSFYSELWGRLVYGAQPLWFNLFYCGALLLAMALLALGVHLRRFYRLRGWAGALLAPALILTSIGAGGYFSGVQAALSKPGVGYTPSEPSIFTVTSYDLVLDLSDPRMPGFTAQMVIQNTASTPLSELLFHLNPTLAVTGAGLPVEREGALLRVLLSEPLPPEATLVMSLRYESALRMESISRGVVVATDFIDRRGVRLTPQSAWYPIPADSTATPGLHDLARLRLAITGSDLPIAANLPAVGNNVFESEAAGWVFLVGSPQLVVEHFGEVTLITSQADHAQARQFAGVFTDLLRQITPFFPEAPLHGLILMLLDQEGGLPEDTPPVAGYPLVVTQRYALINMASNPDFFRRFIIHTLVVDLWKLNGGVLDPRYSGPVTGLNMMFGTVVSFLDAYLEGNGDAAQMVAQVQTEADGQGWEPDPALLALVEVYRQDGREGVAAVLRQVYTRPDELRALSYDSIPQWIQDAARVR